MEFENLTQEIKITSDDHFKTSKETQEKHMQQIENSLKQLNINLNKSNQENVNRVQKIVNEQNERYQKLIAKLKKPKTPPPLMFLLLQPKLIDLFFTAVLLGPRAKLNLFSIRVSMSLTPSTDVNQALGSSFLQRF